VNNETTRPFTESEIYDRAHGLPVNKMNGHDDMPMIVLKVLGTDCNTIPMLTELANCIKDDISKELLMGMHVVIPKKGKKLEPMEGRPLTILPNLTRFVDGIMARRINTFNERFQIIRHTQQGFITGGRTITNAVKIQKTIEQRVQEGKWTDIALIDLKNAYGEAKKYKYIECMKLLKLS
jgi:hypothetical protein